MIIARHFAGVRGTGGVFAALLVTLVLTQASCGGGGRRQDVVAASPMGGGGATPAQAQSAPTPAPTPAPIAAAPPRLRDYSIREVDFLNFTYDWFPKGFDAPRGVRAVSLKDGEMEFDIAPGELADLGAISFSDISYGDVTGDQIEDAVVVLLIDTIGNPRPFGVLVYTVSRGKPRLLWAHTSGGGGDRGLRDAYAGDGRLVIEEYNPHTLTDDSGKTAHLGGALSYTRTYHEWDGRTFRRARSEELPNEDGNAHYKRGPRHHELGEPPADQPPRPASSPQEAGP